MDYQQKIYLALAISVIAIIALLLLLICPLVNKLKASSVILSEKSIIAYSYEEKSGSYLKQLKDEYTILEPKILGIEKSFVNPEKAVDFILAIEEIVALTNNYQEIREIKISEGDKNILAFQVSLWGSFPNFIKCLAQIENMDYFVDSELLQMARLDEGDLKILEDKGITVSVGDIKSVLEIKIYTH